MTLYTEFSKCAHSGQCWSNGCRFHGTEPRHNHSKGCQQITARQNKQQQYWYQDKINSLKFWAWQTWANELCAYLHNISRVPTCESKVVSCHNTLFANGHTKWYGLVDCSRNNQIKFFNIFKGEVCTKYIYLYTLVSLALKSLSVRQLKIFTLLVSLDPPPQRVFQVPWPQDAKVWQRELDLTKKTFLPTYQVGITNLRENL